MAVLVVRALLLNLGPLNCFSPLLSPAYKLQMTSPNQPHDTHETTKSIKQKTPTKNQTHVHAFARTDLVLALPRVPGLC